MPIITVEIMKIIDDRETQKKKKKTEKCKGMLQATVKG